MARQMITTVKTFALLLAAGLIFGALKALKPALEKAFLLFGNF